MDFKFTGHGERDRRLSVVRSLFPPKGSFRKGNLSMRIVYQRLGCLSSRPAITKIYHPNNDITQSFIHSFLQCSNKPRYDCNVWSKLWRVIAPVCNRACFCFNFFIIRFFVFVRKVIWCGKTT